MSRALDDLLGDATVVCFDELHVHEPGDGGLVIRLLRELLVDRPLTLVITSNYHPDGLLPTAVLPHSGGAFEEPVKVRHEYFLPGIHLIKSSMDIVAVDGGHDYRFDAGVPRPTGFRSGFYIEPRDVQETRRTGLLPPAAPVAITVGTNRTLRAQHSSGGTIGFEFDDLCERHVGAGDVVELTAQFDSWVIYNVPPLERCSPEGAQRLVNFVDVLHDADLRLTITSSVTLEDLVAGRRVPADVARLRSRLTLLRRPSAATVGQR